MFHHLPGCTGNPGTPRLRSGPVQVRYKKVMIEFQSSKKSARFTVKRGQIIMDKKTDKVGEDGKAVYEKVPVRQLTGRIVGLIKPSLEARTIRNINGVATPFFVILMEDGEERYALELQAGGNLASGLLKFLGNIKDFSKPVSIRAYARTGQGQNGPTQFTNFAVEQDGEKVQWVENWPLPQRVTLPSGGTVLDDGAVKAAQNKVMDQVVEATKALRGSTASASAEAEAHDYGMPAEDMPVEAAPAPTIDDLPPAAAEAQGWPF